MGRLLDGALLDLVSDEAYTSSGTPTFPRNEAEACAPSPLPGGKSTNSFSLMVADQMRQALVADARVSGQTWVPKFSLSEYEAMPPGADAEDLVAAYLADLEGETFFSKVVEFLLRDRWSKDPDFVSLAWIGKMQSMLGLARVPRRLWTRYVLTVNRDCEGFSVFFPLLAKRYVENYNPAGMDTWTLFTETVLQDNRTLSHQIQEWDAMFEWSKSEGSWTFRWEKWFALLTKTGLQYHPAVAHRFYSQLPRLIYQLVLPMRFLDYTTLYNFVHHLLGPVDAMNKGNGKPNQDTQGKQPRNSKQTFLGKPKDAGPKPGPSSAPSLSSTQAQLATPPSNLSFH